ncbi:hypothetical protein AG1IA_04238 [Rhizoctonia solani AG-1 IA]|uniref:Uncharacterized protein n=1 Tax=Thanatephorus cucumeris (strain AG1-IA) TaxID=983506 RepID=L8WUC3_THACA|nr:hypothetical protein AG1IA_04238 [Rhizoctonia solani AG-1 IA]
MVINEAVSQARSNLHASAYFSMSTIGLDAFNALSCLMPCVMSETMRRRTRIYTNAPDTTNAIHIDLDRPTSTTFLYPCNVRFLR